MADIGETLIEQVAATYRTYRKMAEAAAEQVDDGAFFAPLSDEENSIALVMKHVGGNLRSRFTGFLTSDGEKPDRDRDSEFEDASQDRAAIQRIWDTGWSALFDALAGLGPDDLARTVTIRGEPHGVIQALMRSLAHTSSHVGQIVMLAKHHAGPAWRTLSIPRKASAQFNAKMQERFAAGTESAETAPR